MTSCLSASRDCNWWELMTIAWFTVNSDNCSVVNPCNSQPATWSQYQCRWRHSREDIAIIVAATDTSLTFTGIRFVSTTSTCIVVIHKNMYPGPNSIYILTLLVRNGTKACFICQGMFFMCTFFIERWFSFRRTGANLVFHVVSLSQELRTLNSIAGICLMTNSCTALTSPIFAMSDLVRPPISQKNNTNGNHNAFCHNAR